MGKYSQKEVSKESDFKTKFKQSMNEELDDYFKKIIDNPPTVNHSYMKIGNEYFPVTEINGIVIMDYPDRLK